jgi:hypothetical protein
MFKISTNMRNTVLVLSTCMLGISSSGCSSIQSAMNAVQAPSEQADSPQIDLSKFVNRTFEVLYSAKFPGVNKYKSISGLRVTASETGHSPKVSFLELGRLTNDCVREGVVVDLNTQSNAADEKINLIFQILEVRKYDAHESFIKIKVLNKKFFDTNWWISSYDFLRLAKAPKDDSPFKLPF